MITELLGQLDQVQISFLFLFFGSWFLLMLMFFLFQFRLALYKSKTNPTNLEPVSIVICAKNEAENLLTNIPHIMEQDYPNFEVIVVNDSSWDNSEDILKAFSGQYDNFKYVTLNEDIQRMTGKKFALTMGIKATKHEILLLADADCAPKSKMWIKDLVLSKGQNEIVLGVSLLNKGKGLLKNLFRFESVQTAIHYMSFANSGVPYMGVGRNLMYEKQLFFRNGGFKKHMHIPGGDDDLFINQAASKKNTGIEPDIDSHTCSESCSSISEWWVQKKRHLYTSNFYKLKNKFLLGLEPALWWSMWMSAIVLVLLRTPLLLILMALVIRYIVVSATFISICKKWKAADSLWLWPVWEIALNILRPMVLVSNKISKPKKWRM